jgi:hypothetical protein
VCHETACCAGGQHQFDVAAQFGIRATLVGKPCGTLSRRDRQSVQKNLLQGSRLGCHGSVLVRCDNPNASGAADLSQFFSE